jgi:hypothetical protein
MKIREILMLKEQDLVEDTTGQMGAGLIRVAPPRPQTTDNLLSTIRKTYSESVDANSIDAE